MSNPAQHLTVKEAADVLGVSTKTLRRWGEKGKLIPERTSGGHRRYSQELVSRYKNKKTAKPGDAEGKPLAKSDLFSPGNISEFKNFLPTLYQTLPGTQKRVVKSVAGILAVTLTLVLFKPGFDRLGQSLGTVSNNKETAQSGSSVLAAFTSFEDILFKVNTASRFGGTIEALGGIDVTGSLNLGGIPLSATVAELNYLDDLTLNAGGILYATSTGITSSAAGSSGQVLVSAGTGAPTWKSQADIDAGKLDSIDSTSFLRSDTSDAFTSGTLTFSDGTFLDLSAILNDDSTAQGLKLPQNTSFTSPSTGEGFLAWDTDDNILTVFNGTSWAAVGLWADAGTVTYLTDTSEDLAIGGSTLASAFSVDVSANTVRIGSGATANAVLALYASDGDTGSITYNTSDTFAFSGGAVTFDGNLTFGDTIADTITFTGYVGSSIIPSTGSAYDLGSNTRRFSTVWGDTANFTNLSSGTTDISGTTQTDFLINSDNTSADIESATITFERGAPAVNAEIRWDSTNKYFSINAPGFAIAPDSGITASGKAALIVDQIQAQDILTASDSGTTRFRIADGGDVYVGSGTFNNTSANEDVYVTGNLEVDGSIYGNVAGALTASGFSQGSVVFTGASGVLSQDNTNFFWDNTNDYLGIGTATPDYQLEVVSNGTNGVLELTGDSVTTGTAALLSVDGLSTGKGLYIESTSTALSSGSLASIYWNPGSSKTATGDIFLVNVGANAVVTGNIFAVQNNGSDVFTVSQSAIISALPHSFTAAGDVSFAYDLILTNQTSGNIKSYGPLTIESGESFENNNLTLKTYGTGDIVFDLSGTGSLQAVGTDPSLIFDVTTATDTDFWLGVIDDAGGDDDDLFQIGDGTTPGTNPFVTINTSGSVGIGTTAPDARLEINHATGDNLRLTYNDADGSATNFTDFSLDSTGGLTLTGSAASVASGASAEKTFLTLTPATITLTGTTQVTSLMDTYLLNRATIAGDTATVTVDDAATLTIAGPPAEGTNVSLTEAYGLKINAAATTATTAYGLYVDAPTGAGSNYGAIFASGNVGIGDTTPASLLSVGSGDLFQVNSSGYALLPNGSASTPALTFTGDTDTGLYIIGGNSMGFAAGGGEIARIDTGSLQVANSKVLKLSETGSAAAPALTWPSDTDTGLYRIGANQIGLITGGSATAGITINNGSVGIGTTGPDAKLEINHATGDNLRLTYNDADGSATAYTDFSLASDGDLTIDSAGGNINLSDVITISPATTGTHLDFALETEWTTGDLINADWASATTQSGALTLIDLDFTNLTSVAGSTTYGLHINDLAAKTTSTEYAIYQEGTLWDIGIMAEAGIAVGAQQAFTNQDATPSVTGGSHFTTANTLATTITDFDDGVSGQIMVIEIGDNNTTIDCTVNANLNCGSTDVTYGTGDILTWIHDGTVWNLISFVDISAAQTGADLAEWYPADLANLPVAGEIVAIGPSLGSYTTSDGVTHKAFSVEETSSEYDKKMVGVVSTQAWNTMGEDILNWAEGVVKVGLTGRVHTKVAPDSPVITAGDPITSSSTHPGMGTKALEQGNIIGKALEDWGPENGQETILVFLNNSVSLQGSSLQEEEVTLETIKQLLAEAEGGSEIASQVDSWEEELVTKNLYVLDTAAITSLSVTKPLIVGSDLIIQSSTLETTTLNSIDSLSFPLSLQSTASQPLLIMAGKVTIDTEGNVKIAGNLEVEGQITTKSLVLSDNSSYGEATLPAGETEVKIENSKIENSSLINLTPLGTTSGKTLFVKEKIACQAESDSVNEPCVPGFIVSIDGIASFDIPFSWWVVGVADKSQ